MSVALLIVLVILAAVVLLAAVLLVRAFSLKPSSVTDPLPQSDFIGSDQSVERFREILRSATIWACGDPGVNQGAFDEFVPKLRRLYPRVFAALEYTPINSYGIMLHWPGTDAGKQPVVLMAHYDVVEANPIGWEHEPFAAEVVDGRIWARGAIDTKCIIAAVLEAIDTLLENGFRPARDVYFCSSNCEEDSGDTTPAMVEYFRQQGIAPALVLDEGGAVIDNAPLGVKGLFAAIGVSEKGIANFRITTNAKGGHASTPAPSDATAKLVSGLESLQRHPAPARLHAATKAMLRELAARGGLGLKLVFANLWLFGPLVLRIMKNNSETAAMVRTTYALTELAGSKAANVIPKQAHATINARIDSSESIAEAFARLQKHFDDQTEFTIADANEPSPISPFDASGTATSAWGSQANSPAGTAAPAAKPELGDKPQLGDKPEPGDKPHRQVDNPIDNPAGTDPGFEYLRRVTHSVYPEAGCAPYLMSAATDARHFTAICPRVYRFAGILFKGDQRNTVHGQNENIDILSFQRGVGFYRQFLQYLDQLRL